MPRITTQVTPPMQSIPRFPGKAACQVARPVVSIGIWDPTRLIGNGPWSAGKCCAVRLNQPPFLRSEARIPFRAPCSRRCSKASSKIGPLTKEAIVSRLCKAAQASNRYHSARANPCVLAICLAIVRRHGILLTQLQYNFLRAMLA